MSHQHQNPCLHWGQHQGRNAGQCRNQHPGRNAGRSRHQSQNPGSRQSHSQARYRWQAMGQNLPFLVRRTLQRQRGFSLIEVSIVTAIVLLLAIIGIPAVGSYVIENKVPKVGEELARFVLQTKVNAPHGSSEPYLGIATSSFANTVRESSIFSVSGTEASPKVLHGLGKAGEVTVAPADLGAAFAITLTNINHVACPAIASVLQRVSDSMTVDGTTIKDATTSYSALATEALCTKGDVNTFVFTAS